MRISNSRDYDEAPLEITVQDLAIIFDELDIGIRFQMDIAGRLWDDYRWILQKKYRSLKKRKAFIQDVLYQIDYLYNKKEIDGIVEVIERDAKEVGYKVERESLTEDYAAISELFKRIWIQLNFISTSGYIRIKFRTILTKYHYKRRSSRLCDYIYKCLKFYRLQLFVQGEPCIIENIPLDTMITVRSKKKKGSALIKK